MEEPKQIKQKLGQDSMYHLIHWPGNNSYVITASYINSASSGPAPQDRQIASFDNEKEAMDYFDNVK